MNTLKLLKTRQGDCYLAAYYKDTNVPNKTITKRYQFLPVTQNNYEVVELGTNRLIETQYTMSLGVFIAEVYGNPPVELAKAFVEFVIPNQVITPTESTNNRCYSFTIRPKD